MGLGMVGTAIKVGSEASASAAQQAIARQNQMIANTAAAAASERGAFEAGRAITKGNLVGGAQQAGYSASGVVTNRGSPLDVLVGTGAVSQEDAQTLRNNAMREAWGYKQQAAGIGLEAQYQKQQADFSQMSTLLTGAASIAGGAIKYNGGGGA
jgi:hypothetical protein